MRYELVIDHAGREIRREFKTDHDAMALVPYYRQHPDTFSITLYDYESGSKNHIIGHWEHE